MLQHGLLNRSEFIFEHLCSESVLKTAFLAVRKNKGAPGTDGVTVENFQDHLDYEVNQLLSELASWSYQPRPARRVKIPKPSNKKTPQFRNLAIPCVRDRVVQTALKTLLEPHFEPSFSEHSYGFRPGRSARQAVEKAQQICKKGKYFCVDIDLEKFFDRVHHDRLIARLALTIKDKRILRLIGITLRSGIMENGVVSPSSEGTPQGSPLSPLLSNIVLDELDKELERRGFEFCRYADDCNIFVSSPFAAKRAMENITNFIEKRLKLKVNKDKSKVAKSQFVKFLGMTIISGAIAISKQSMQRAKDKLKEIIPRNSGHSLEKTIERFNSWYIGWSNYHLMTQYPAQLRSVEAHARRRLRAIKVKQSKRPRFLYRKLNKMGVKTKGATVVFKNHKCWKLSRSWAMQKAFDCEWFKKMDMYTVSDSKQEHWFPLAYWVWLT